jgi:hypothetical protein
MVDHELTLAIRNVTARINEDNEALERILAMLGGSPPPGKPANPATKRPRLELVTERNAA